MQIKEAVRKSSQYLTDVFETAAGKDLRLEGIEKTDDSRFWKVTFSYESNGGLLGTLSRDYKTVKVRDSDGELMGVQNGMLLAQM